MDRLWTCIGTSMDVYGHVLKIDRKTNESLWMCMGMSRKSNENLQKIMGIYEHLRKCMDMYQNDKKIYGNVLKIYGHVWKCIQNLWKV